MPLASILLVIVPIFIVLFIVFYLSFSYSESQIAKRKYIKEQMKVMEQEEHKPDWSDF